MNDRKEYMEKWRSRNKERIREYSRKQYLKFGRKYYDPKKRSNDFLKDKANTKCPICKGEMSPTAKRCMKCLGMLRKDKKIITGKPFGMGISHPNWRGGITTENKRIKNSIEYHLWRESVFARDNWTCQKTGIKGGYLHPHHIQNFAQFPELRFAIDNGITLSKESHKIFHKKYSNRNNNEIQLKEFLNGK